tara:strand:- start:3 stop:266 length:264 start_codon:yes stop_codon:yes gene_type:complete
MATKMTTGGKGKCPLSSIKGKDNKYMRKVRISADKCVDPTPANQREAYKYQQKQSKLAENKARGAKATQLAAAKEREKARQRGVRLG